MTNNAIVRGEYVTFKHIKTRKMVVLEIEVPEECFQEVISKLGMPIGGESKPVAVALLAKEMYNKPPVVGISDIQQASLDCSQISTSSVAVGTIQAEEKTEGERLRTRAVMVCKEREFQIFCESLDKNIIVFNENHARDFICGYCCIKSRSELARNTEAQTKFKELLTKFDSWFDSWKMERQYSDNLSRY